MIVPHTFEEETHVYKVAGQWALSTSDVLSLNGFSDYAQIPKQVLDHASWRGTQLHKAIQFFEEDADVPDMPDEVKPYFQGYMKFRMDYEFEPVGALEKQICYIHAATEQVIGCTIDLRGMLRGQPYICDAKTTAKMYGKAMKSKCLAWRLQLQSYKEATLEDLQWFSMLPEQELKPIGKGIIQVNKNAGYEFHDFSSCEDDFLWDASVRIAMAKLANGFELDRR